MAVTIRDVARAAGVSISTVSRALATPEKVAEPTRDRVQKLAQDLGYHPNRAARGLITGRTGCIGLVVPDLENPFFGSISKGVQRRARALGYSVFIADSEEDPVVEAELVRSIAKQVDGVILCSARGSDESVRELAAHTPLILINRVIEGILSISFDSGGGLRAITRHLVALGHREIAYAGGPVSSWSNAERLKSLRACGEELPHLSLIELGNFTPSAAGGIHAADLAIAEGVTAVIAYNDLMAVGVIDRLSQRGLATPGDMSVVSFDNVPIASMVRPALTTVDLPRLQIGRMGVEALVATVDGRGPDPEALKDIPVDLVVRDSSGVVPTRAHVQPAHN